MTRSMEIQSFIVVSTGHVTEQTAKMLNETPSAKWPCAGGPYADYGWFVYAHDENAGEGDQQIPDDLFAVMTWARQQNVHYVLLDCDADPVDALPYFDW